LSLTSQVLHLHVFVHAFFSCNIGTSKLLLSRHSSHPDLIQKEGEYHDKTFSPVEGYTSIRSIISIASVMGWKLHQMDVKTSFLNGASEEEVYIEQPQGFVIHGKESHVCKLKKYLYGIKKEPKSWYVRIDNYLMTLGFTKSDADPKLYYKVEEGFPLILVLYMDDLFLIGDEKIIDG
jgi:hypothetical protein